ncbi:MAG: LAGLIDADG family homing endonuclease [Acidimicrobiia bacterium]
MLAGFVAGEGSFNVTRRLPPFADRVPRLSFRFDVTVATRDRPILEQLRSLLGFGSITDRRPGKPAWQPTSQLRIASIKAHLAATIPWADEHLLVSNKRAQYERWRDALLGYEIEHPRQVGRSRCSEPGCDDFVRGRGLCRRHYYRATGY